jgi:putative signal transducing protein
MALVTLRTYRNLIDAELAIAQLEAAGIPAVVVDQQLGSTFSAALGEVRVQVDESNLARARGFLREDIQSEPTSKSSPGERKRHGSRRGGWIVVVLWVLIACVLFTYCHRVGRQFGYKRPTRIEGAPPVRW